jgi:hypothetical protein
MFLFLAVQYNTDDSMDGANEASYVRRILKKLQMKELKVHVHGKSYVCPWCWMKPKDGQKVSLVQHAITLSSGKKTKMECVNHKALAQYLTSA